MNEQSIVNQMLLAGLECPPLPLSLGGERFRRWGRKKTSWYKLREMRMDSGRSVIVGAFGDWKTGLVQPVEIDWKGISDEERDSLAKLRMQQAVREEEERRRAAQLAAMSAADLWAQGTIDGESGYIVRKGVQAEACRYLADGSILVPLIRYDMPRNIALRAVQRIWSDGRKRFTRGFEKPGCCLRLGAATNGEVILLAEGYATALTLRMATDWAVPVVMCLDAGNLIHVAELLRRLYPDSRMLICADDDWRTLARDGTTLNVGRLKAAEVAKALPGVDVVYPVWRGLREAGDTDFNDLHAREGLAAVTRQLSWVLQVIRTKQVPHA